MKKKLCIALLSVLMLTACSTGGQSSGGSQIEASSGEQSTEVSTTPSSSVAPTPEYKTLTLEEAQAQAKTMVAYINSNKYVELNSYQYVTAKSKKTSSSNEIDKRVFTINREEEKMSMYLYDSGAVNVNPYLGRWLTKKEAGSYYHFEQTSKTKKYQTVATADFESALGSAKYEEKSYKESVGKLAAKNSAVTILDSFSKHDFSSVTGLTTRLKGDGEGKFEIYFKKIVTIEDSSVKTIIKKYTFENYYLVQTDILDKLTDAESNIIEQTNYHESYDIKKWNIEVPTVDDTWSETL